MRAPLIYVLLLFGALAVAGCAASPVASVPSSGGSAASPTSVPATQVPAAAPTTPPAATSAPAAATSAPTPAPAASPATNANDQTAAAIKAVIDKGNQEQQDAFAKGDPTVMKDTSTSSYYTELAGINSDMSNSGVKAIKLLKTEWGAVTMTNSTTAQATTFETWQTTYADGSTDQGRERNVYTVVQEQGAWKIQADDHPDAVPSVPGGSSASTRPGSAAPAPSGSGAPAPSAPTPASQTGSSRNWAGYAASAGNFTAVTGTWKVPQSQSSGRLSSGATWVGIGGVQSRDLIQAGTEETTTQQGTIQYDAWIETLPQAARVVPFNVKPGDSVNVSISQQSAGQWLVKFTNQTTGETFQRTVQYSSSLSSAEWVEEAPSAGRRVLPIDNFGTVQFSGGTAVENGKTVTIAQSGAQPITLDGANGSPIAVPSQLTPDGQGFSVSQSTN